MEKLKSVPTKVVCCRCKSYKRPKCHNKKASEFWPHVDGFVPRKHTCTYAEVRK